MPVWHAKTKDLVEAGALTVVGIVHEQHPDRAALYAQWKGLDFPILWDPFGVTGLKVVPVATAIDSAGIVRLPRPDPRKFDKQFVPEFLERSFEAAPLSGADMPAGFRTSGKSPMAAVMRGGVGGFGELGDSLAQLIAEGEKDAATPFEQFSAGVARRMRHDSTLAQLGDFQRALDDWSAALRVDPNQYIWRRRIQQWGPRLDKPYPFYDWVDAAIAEVTARDQQPVTILARLSGSERATKTRSVPGGATTDPASAKAPEPPDPERRVTVGASGPGAPVSLEIAIAPHTGMLGSQVRTPPGSSRVHVTLRPGSGAKWALDADPPEVWLELPRGWNAVSPRVGLPMPHKGEETRALSQDFEVSTDPTALGPPDESQAPPSSAIPGYVVYSVCLDDGTCVFRRLDFTLQLPFPAPPSDDR